MLLPTKPRKKATKKAAKKSRCQQCNKKIAVKQRYCSDGCNLSFVSAEKDRLELKLTHELENHAFTRGFAAALTDSSRRVMHGQPDLVVAVMKNAGLTLADLKEAGVNESDLKEIRKLLKRG
jgi:hypothetical protein